jgi:hypothetical protein
MNHVTVLFREGRHCSFMADYSGFVLLTSGLRFGQNVSQRNRRLLPRGRSFGGNIER